jgi:hypothetical protein
MVDLPFNLAVVIAGGTVLFNAGVMWTLVNTARTDILDLKKALIDVRDNHLKHIYDKLANLDAHVRLNGK